MVADEALQPRKSPWRQKRVWIPLLLLALLLIAAFGAVRWIDSAAGHRYIIAQIEKQRPENGLRIGIGAIEGSVFRNAVLRDLELSDPRGAFLRVAETRLDWRPLSWLFRELHIRELEAAKANLLRLPELIPPKQPQPLLPDFDIFIGRFVFDSVTIDQAITGTTQSASLSGALDIRSGRAVVSLNGKTAVSGDSLTLALNAEPEQRRFDLDGQVNMPINGVLARYLKLDRPIAARINGDGDWESWNGSLLIKSDTIRLANAGLALRSGIFGLSGTAQSALFPAGLAQRLTAPEVRIRGSGEYADKVIRLQGTARTLALALTAKGGIDLGRNALDAMRIDLGIAQPGQLAANLASTGGGSIAGEAVRLQAILNGPLQELRYQYLLASPRVILGKTELVNLQVEGKGRRDAVGWSIPVEASMAGVEGNGELIERIARNLTLVGMIRAEKGRITSTPITIKTAEASGVAKVDAVLASGDYLITLDAQALGFEQKGVGRANVLANLRFTPGTGGIALAGDAKAQLLRLDNDFLRQLAGGLPSLTTGLSLTQDRRLAFNALKIVSPKLTLSADGRQLPEGAFAFVGNGTHSQYGRFDIDLKGLLDRPNVDLLLYNPMDAAGLSRVRLALVPEARGFTFGTSGGSTLGPFDGNGAILLPAGGQALIRFDRLNVSDTIATGTVRPGADGLDGNFTLAGGGVEGTILLRPNGNSQIVRADLTARNARFTGRFPLAIRVGKLEADMVLADGRSTVDATVSAQGISRGSLMIGRLAANAKLVNGSGSATASISGTRGSSFALQGSAQITLDRYSIAASGEFENRPLRLTRNMVITRTGDGWRVAPTALRYAGGEVRFAGLVGQGSSELSLQFAKMPLTLLDIGFDGLGLGGIASGTAEFRQSGDAMPTGSAKLNVRGLTRSGLVMTSAPADLGLNLALTSRNLAARGVINSGGKTIGRLQARITGIDNGPNWSNSIRTAPLFAQARFVGGAESLWRLTGVETFDLTGTVALTADIRGSVANPQIEGRAQTGNARLESPLTGTVVSGIKADGQFDGSRLRFERFTGNTSGGGTVSGSGSFDLATGAGEGIGIDLKLIADRAVLIARDDFAATVSGPIAITSNRGGGIISGDVTLNRSFFRFGRAQATASLPNIKTREINRRADERPLVIVDRPWRFALTATAPSRLMVEGLGLDSEWRAKLQVSGPVDNFALTGDANMIRGDYDFSGRRFQLTRGTIRFIGNRPPNPLLDIVAESRLSDLEAKVMISGTGDRPIIAFSSNPALPEDELLARMLFGTSLTNLSAPEALQLASAVAAMNGNGGLDPINSLRRAVGLDRLRIVAADPNTGQGTSVAVGKYITDRTYVEIITDGQGYSATRLEFQISRWLSLLSTISTIGRQSVNARISRDY